VTRAASALQLVSRMGVVRRLLVLSPFAAVALAAACSGTGATGDTSDTSATVPADDGGANVHVDASLGVPPEPPAPIAPAPPTTPPPTAPAVVDAGDVDDSPSCTPANDERDQLLKLVWFPDVGPSYAPGCIYVRAGASVTFLGDFERYPMVPFGDGASNPIPVTASGTSATVTFFTNGRYRFGSPAFPGMRGAIEVVP